MKKILILLCTLLSANDFALNVTAKKFEVTVTVKALRKADLSIVGRSNEYNLLIGLQKKKDYYNVSAYHNLISLSGSDNRTNSNILVNFRRVKLGDSFTRKAIVYLPSDVLDATYVNLSLYEADFTIPVPFPCGGCVFNINDDDKEFSKNFDIEEQSFEFESETALIKIDFKQVIQEESSLDKVVREQARAAFPRFKFMDVPSPIHEHKYLSALYEHILEEL